MRLKALSILLVIAVFFSANGHLVVLQVVAWGTMAKQFHSETELISVTLNKTFSGEFPCPICHSIEDSLEANRAENVDNKTAGLFQKSPNYLTLFLPPISSLVLKSGNLFAEEIFLHAGSISLIDPPPPRVFRVIQS